MVNSKSFMFFVPKLTKVHHWQMFCPLTIHFQLLFPLKLSFIADFPIINGHATGTWMKLEVHTIYYRPIYISYKILTATVWDHQKLLFFIFFIIIFMFIFIIIFIIIFSFYLHFFILSSFFSFATSFFHLQLHFFICNFIFFICNFIFFHFPLFLMVFYCFSLIFMAFLDFRCHGQGKWKKNDKKMIKTWKFPRVFEDFLVRSENLQLWVQIFIFFSFATSFFFIFLCFWMVFHCFSWLSWISGATGKENEKKW